MVTPLYKNTHSYQNKIKAAFLDSNNRYFSTHLFDINIISDLVDQIELIKFGII